jgi:hypothetical protein
MPGFDFANAKLTEWVTPLPADRLFMYETAWDQGTFVAHLYQLDGSTDKTRLFKIYRLKCKPEFVLLVKHETLALSLASRSGDLGLNCKNTIVQDSEWVASFRKEESYGDSLTDKPMVHYILCCGNDFAHLLSKDVPEITELGMIRDEDWASLRSCISQLEERMDDIVKPAATYGSYKTFDQAMREHIAYGKSRKLKHV